MNDNNSSNGNSYEELIKKGYVEEGPLEVDTEHLMGIDISKTSFDPDKHPQQGRMDSTTRVVSPDGSETKLTPFVTGRKYQIANGRYVSATEFAEALEDAANSLEEGTLIVSKTGKVLNPEELFEFAQSVANVITIGDKVDTMPFPAVERSITTPEGDERKLPPAMGGGVRVIGKDKYYFAEGLAEALEDFVIMSPPKAVGDEPKEEETIKVVRVEKHWKNRATAWLCAAALALVLASGLSLDKIPPSIQQIPTKEIVMMETDKLDYRFIEQMREMGYEEDIIKEVFLRFAAESGFDIGRTVDFDKKTNAYEYGNLTGRHTTLQGEQTITGYCLYGPDNTKSEYSFYEDRNLDGKAERLSPSGIQEKVNLTLDEFLSHLDTANYDLSDIRFSLHFGNKGWVDFSDLIHVNEETKDVAIEKLVEICKDVATYEGTIENFDADFVEIKNADGDSVWIPVTDENDQLYAPGSKVIGSDGKEYVIAELSLEEDLVATEVETMTEVETKGKTRLKWSFEDCELALAIAPLIGAAAFAIASKIRNERYKKDPDFFEFEDDPEYRRFKQDFEKAREDYRKSSKFGQVLKRVFYGEELHVSSTLTDEQVQEMYSTIVNTHNGDYSYSPSDQIRFQNGQVYAYRSDGTRQNITDTVSHIGKDNKTESEGLLTDEIVEKYGGSKKV